MGQRRVHGEITSASVPNSREDSLSSRCSDSLSSLSWLRPPLEHLVEVIMSTDTTRSIVTPSTMSSCPSTATPSPRRFTTVPLLLVTTPRLFLTVTDTARGRLRLSPAMATPAAPRASRRWTDSARRCLTRTPGRWPGPCASRSPSRSPTRCAAPPTPTGPRPPSVTPATDITEPSSDTIKKCFVFLFWSFRRIKYLFQKKKFFQKKKKKKKKKK